MATVVRLTEEKLLHVVNHLIESLNESATEYFPLFDIIRQMESKLAAEGLRSDKIAQIIKRNLGKYVDDYFAIQLSHKAPIPVLESRLPGGSITKVLPLIRSLEDKYLSSGLDRETAHTLIKQEVMDHVDRYFQREY